MSKLFEERFTKAGFTAKQANDIELLLEKQAKGCTDFPSNENLQTVICAVVVNNCDDVTPYIKRKQRVTSEETKKANCEKQIQKVLAKYGYTLNDVKGGNE